MSFQSPDVIVRIRAKILKPDKKLMNMIAQEMLSCVRKNFAEEGRPKWHPLAKMTVNERKKLGYWPGKILQRTGLLLRSIQARATDTEAIVSTNKAYAAIHQYGGTINHSSRSESFKRARYKVGTKKGKFKKLNKKNTVSGPGYTFKSYSVKVPARPFLTLTDQDIQFIKQKFIDNLFKQL